MIPGSRFTVRSGALVTIAIGIAATSVVVGSLSGEIPERLAAAGALSGLGWFGAGVLVGMVALGRGDRGSRRAVSRGDSGAAGDPLGRAAPTVAGPADDAVVSDEARIMRLLRRGEGRLKQSDIVEQTNWSKSKVSRLLSRMAEDGRVVKIKLGRENLICLAGDEPEIATDGPPAPG